MKIIIPMSGVGRRFLNAGYTTPKPLIPVEGKPLIEYVVNLFEGEKDFLFVCNEQNLEKTTMRLELQRIAPQGTIVSIPSHSLGPVYAVLQAEEHIADDEPLMISYCDYNMIWDYAHFKDFVKQKDCDAALPCYIGHHPHLRVAENMYASVRVDEHNRMLEIREKHSFTKDKRHSYQSPGTFYFKKGSTVKKYFRQLMDEKIELNGEYYVSMVYNLLQRDGLTTYVFEVDQFCQWGTPEDLEDFLYWSRYFRRK